MKVTVNQISEGVGRYIDGELMPKVSGIRKWFLGVAGVYAGKMVEDKIAEHRDVLINAGIMSEDGMVDIDRFMPQLKAMAAESGPVTEHVSMLGDITFDSSDVEKLYSYIVG